MVKVHLEIRGMVRACRPITPHVGLCKQTRDPERNKMYYKEARKKRDTICFPSMLRQATKRCLGYKALRRLWIQTLSQFLQIHQYTYFIIQTIVEYLPKEEPERIPMFYTHHYWRLDYASLSPSLRMEQLAGKLHALGYTRMILPEPDYELEGYLILAKDPYSHHRNDTIPFLYQELKRKNIVDKYPILYSHIRYRNFQLAYTKEDWITFCYQNKLILYLNACIRANRLSTEEIELLNHWIHFMKVPNR
jgi:hypothetical protein